MFLDLTQSSAVLQTFQQNFALVHAWLFEHLVQPSVFQLGLMVHQEQAFDATEWFMWGVLEVVFLFLILRPLEKWLPAETWLDRHGTGVDILYTGIHRLGVFPLALYFLLTPAADVFEGWLRLHGIVRFQLDNLIPGITDTPLISFLIYLIVLDFFDYWVHRAQHASRYWWALHAVHHSQRKMSFWTDNRNHLFDDFLRDLLFVTVAMVIGVEPGQFMGLIILSRISQNVQHANLKISFGRVFEKIFVSPRFHRLHHAMGYGHDGKARGCNFAVLFPLWDIIFKTADFQPTYHPTGISDQLEGRDYGSGFISQQYLALQSIMRLIRNKTL